MTIVHLSDLPRSPPGKTGWPWTTGNQPDENAKNVIVWPKITIVTPSYNYGRFIEETIRSVLLQGYPNLEYIVIDGGSTDCTVDILRKYDQYIDFWQSEPDNGQSNAINKGFVRANGDILAWLNSDDVFQDHALVTIGRYFADNPKCEFLAGHGEIREVTGRRILWRVEDLPSTFGELLEFPLGRYFAQPSVFFRRRVLNRVAPLNEELHYAMDLDLWLRIAEHHKLDLLPETLSWMRAHVDAKTYRDYLQVFMEAESIIGRYRLMLPVLKYRKLLRALRRGKANGALKYSAMRQGCPKRMRAGIYHAFRCDMTVVFTRRWVGMALSSVLPLRLRRLVFPVSGDRSQLSKIDEGGKESSL